VLDAAPGWRSIASINRESPDMPTDLTISSAGTPVTSPDRARSNQPAPSATFEANTSGPPPPSPTLRFNASLGILVIEFHNDAGQVANSIPTQRQLEAYRTRADAGPQPVPQLFPTESQAASGTPETASPAAAKPIIVA
jgi:hypothetical protein